MYYSYLRWLLITIQYDEQMPPTVKCGEEDGVLVAVIKKISGSILSKALTKINHFSNVVLYERHTVQSSHQNASFTIDRLSLLIYCLTVKYFITSYIHIFTIHIFIHLYYLRVLFITF